MRRCDSDGSIYATRFGGANLFFFTPEVLPFGFGIEPVMVLIMMPIFIVSATESIGDLTATNRLSGHRHGDESYWLRIRGGLMGDSLNSGLGGRSRHLPQHHVQSE